MSHASRFVPTAFARENARASHRRRRILVAENDPELRRLVAEALRSQGHDVVEAPDSTQLLFDLLERHFDPQQEDDGVDLILTDVRMPGCSGLDLLEMLREAHWETPVILMTALGGSEIESRADVLGAVILEKPFRLDLLRSAVRTCLS